MAGGGINARLVYKFISGGVRRGVDVNNNLKLVMIGAGGLYAWYKYRQAKAAIIETVTTKLNPASSENLIYQGTQQAGTALGKWLYRVTH